MASLIWTSPGRRAIGCRPDRANRVLAMPAKTEGGGRAFARVERLLDALADPSRRERTVVVVLLGYVALWTLYGAIAKASQDIHADMSEQFALGRELALGYPKHPPLAMLVVRAWFSVFPTADWAYYLLVPSLVLVAAVAVYPVASGVWLSFQRYNLLRAPSPSFTGLAQYVYLWTDSVFWTAARNTVVWVAVGAGSQFLLGLIVALALNRPRLRGTSKRRSNYWMRVTGPAAAGRPAS